MENTYTLAQIATRELERHATVLFDTSAVSTQLPSLTRPCGRYHDLNPAVIARGQWEFSQYAAFANASNARTAVGVITEMKSEHTILLQRKRIWDRREREVQGRMRAVYFPPQREAFKRMLATEEQLITASEHAILHPTDTDAEENVQRLVTTLQQHLHVKREKVEHRKHYAHFQTDEELVALTLYLSFVERQHATIVTRDFDFPSLLIACYTVLTTPVCNPLHEAFEAHFRQFPLGIYFPAYRGAECYTFFDLEEMVALMPRERSVEHTTWKRAEDLNPLVEYLMGGFLDEKQPSQTP